MRFWVPPPGIPSMGLFQGRLATSQSGRSATQSMSFVQWASAI